MFLTRIDVPLGGYVTAKKPISFHEKLPVTTLAVRNTGDRPIQVGSHFHFFEVNRALSSRRRCCSMLSIEHEPQARNSQPAVSARIIFREEIAVTDRTAALQPGVTTAKSENQADKADAGANVDEEAE